MFIKRLKTLYLPRERCGVLQYVDIAVLHVTRFRFSKTSSVSLFAYKEFTFIKTRNTPHQTCRILTKSIILVLGLLVLQIWTPQLCIRK